MVLPFIDMNQPWVYMCPLSRIPLPPPSPSHLSGSSQCTSPELPVLCIKPALVIYFTYDNIHVSMLSLKSSHPCLLPQSPKVCSLHLCLFCCLAYRDIYMSLIVTIFFKYHMYALIYCIGFFLSDLLHSV